jgi:hypothetical protein
MPANQAAPTKKPGGGTKKKGHAPAHQNKFAWTHNPKSKKTQKILESPNIHVCRRCHDKIEWRKQYRKYKPRTQPGVCNGCEKRNVLFAYHTICETCTTNSIKAKEIINCSMQQGMPGEQEGSETAAEQPEQQTQQRLKLPMGASTGKLRACAVCVKELALPDPDDEEDEDMLDSMGRLRLRERKTLERQLAAREAEKASKKKNKVDDDDDDEDDDEQSDGDEPGTIPEENDDSVEDEEDNDDASDDGREDEDNEKGGNEKCLDDELDPFLQAVGGADQLLTGEAYQKKLLERLEKQQCSPPATVS